MARPSRFASKRRLSFTREGKYFVALTFGVGFAAINTGNNLLYLLLGMMLALIVASGVLSELSIAGLRARRRVPGRVFAGSPFLIDITLHNPRQRLASFSIEVEDMQDGKPLDKRCYYLKVPAGRTQRTAYRHSVDHRGMITLTGFRVSTRFPFTFFKKSREIQELDQVVVFPKVFDLSPDMGRDGPSARQHGLRLARRGEFYALREYQEGDDDARDIYWRKSARMGKLVVRQHEQRLGRQVAVLLDNRGPETPDHPGDLDRRERTVSLAASLCVHFARRGYTFSLSTRTGGVPSGQGEAHLTRVLRYLALLSFSPQDHPFASLPGKADEAVLVSEAGCRAISPSTWAA